MRIDEAQTVLEQQRVQTAGAHDAKIEKPSLLYVSPVLPSTGGNGLAMRAGMMLEALSTRFRVSLLVVPLYSLHANTTDATITRACHRCAVVRPGRGPERSPRPSSSLLPPEWPERDLPIDPPSWRESPRTTMRRVARAFEGIHFDAVYCFRLYTVPLAEPYLATSRLLRYLDLDDIESTVRRRLAQRYRTYGYEDEAQDEEEEARRYELVERQLLPQFDRIYICSQQDKEELGWRYGCRNLCVVPNALHAADPFPPKAPTTPFTLLFVGTLNYFPNVDALAFLCDDVLPMLRRKTHRPFVVSVIGGGAADVSVRFAHVPEVRMIGRVSDLAPWYQRADVAVVPIQTGGGTRIKVLEAFKYGRPVVSTSVGIEGLEVNHGEHVLVGDTAGAFAECCLRLMADSALAELLARNASLLFRRAYTTEAPTSFLASCFTSEAQMAGVTPATGLIRPTNRVKSCSPSWHTAPAGLWCPKRFMAALCLSGLHGMKRSYRRQLPHAAGRMQYCRKIRRMTPGRLSIGLHDPEGAALGIDRRGEWSFEQDRTHANATPRFRPGICSTCATWFEDPLSGSTVMSFLEGLHGTIAIIVLCGLLFVDEAGLPLPLVPNEVLLLVAGLLIASGGLPIWIFVPVAIIAMLAGMIAGYSWARALGQTGLCTLAERIGATAAYDRTRARLTSASTVSFGFARMIPGIRPYVTLIAGAAQIDMRKFLHQALHDPSPQKAR